MPNKTNQAGEWEDMKKSGCGCYPTNIICSKCEAEFNKKETWEDELDKQFPLPKFLALSDGKGVERDLLKQFIRQTIKQEREEAVREAFKDLREEVLSGKYGTKNRSQLLLKLNKKS